MFADPSVDEVGINGGVLSIYNEGDMAFDDTTVGVTYQLNKHPVKVRMDLDYVNVTDYDGVNSLVKGSANAVYEHETNTNFKPYAIGGVGYEHVDGDAEERFDSHAFVQGGAGVSYGEKDGVKMKLEGKVLQIIGGEDQDNEVVVTAGVTVPVSYFYGDKNECPVKISGPDKDRDGVLDSVDQCPNTPCYFTADQYGCPIKAILRIHFDTDKAIIRPGSLPKVEQFASYLLRNKGSVVRIIGHTDSDGSDEYNMVLSDRRANAVMNKIIELGVSSGRLSSEGRGESEPAASNATNYGKALNRRIEVELTYPNKNNR